MLSVLPPTAPAPRFAPVVATASAARVEMLDALLLFAPATGAARALAAQPHGTLLRRRLQGAARHAGGVFTARLPNDRQTLVVVGLLATDAPAFERLELAGRMTRELHLDECRDVGVAAAGLDTAIETDAVGAGLAALLAASFALPRARGTPSRPRRAAPRLHAFARSAPDTARIAAIAAGNDLARWLTALPPNVLTPGAYRRAVVQLARRRGWRTRFLDERALTRAGAGAFLAVTQGSATRDGGILHVRYRPRGARGAPVALVGKGLCFDTGGTNLKSHRHMLDMHTDMAGSAAALGALLALDRLRHPAPVDLWLALAENRIGPQSYLPQDIVRAANGTTIQVIHTDAEGRMALADTLALASRTAPCAIVDLATLTGACVTALTERLSGVFSNRPEWRDGIEAAGRDSGERVWVLPSPRDFDAEIESKVADVIQCPVEGKGDHIYATRFLAKFVGRDIPWLHVDLSAATRSGGLAHIPTDVTGFGVGFLVELLARQGFPGARRGDRRPDRTPQR
jgi:leucyl aminopeptidase